MMLTSHQCGVVVLVRSGSDIINIWNRTASNKEVIEKTTEELKKLLGFNNISYKENEAGWKKVQVATKKQQGNII